MSFLDRFQGKIATVTAQGHLKKADGSEEIRVGAPKRRPQPQMQKSSLRSSDNNKNHHDAQTMLRQPTKMQSDVAQVVAIKNAPLLSTEVKHSLSPTGESLVVSVKEKTTTFQSQSHREAANYDYNELMKTSGSGSEDIAESQLSSKFLNGKPPGCSIKNARVQNSSQERASLKESIENKGDSDPKDQLAFSRKARPVQYEPCKLSQYKKEKPDGYYELGKLQPDLNTDELVEKRAKIERMKAFSQNRRTINKNIQAKKPADAPREQLVVLKPASTREKGIAFAKRVPKPRLSQKTDAEVSSASSRNIRSNSIEPKSSNAFTDEESDEDELDVELQLLQQRHKASRAEVKALVGSA